MGVKNADYRVDTTLGPLSLRTLYYHSGGAILRLALKQNANLNQYFSHFFMLEKQPLQTFSMAPAMEILFIFIFKMQENI